MKRWIVCVTCLVVLACAAVASAQITGGVKGGINFANVSLTGGGASINMGNRTAWNIGAFFEIPVARNLFLQPEALFTSKGGSLTSGDFLGTGGAATAALKLNYFDVPVLLRFDVPTTSTIVPFVYGGPNLGFLLSAKATATGQPDEDIKPDLKSTDIGLAFGGGARFGKVTAELRYIYGLTNVLSAADAVDAGVSAKNSVVKIMVGYRF